MLIRKLFEKDLPEALELVWSVFSRFEAPEYTQEGIRVFRDFIDPDPIARMLDSGVLRFWGAISQGKIVGVIAIRGTSHISLLFVDPNYHRKGIARTLVSEVERFATLMNCNTITVNSSPYAVAFYERLEFRAISGEREKQGIRFTPMLRQIKKSGP